MIHKLTQNNWASQVALGVKNLPARARDAKDTGSVPGLGRFPEVGNGNSLQYSYLEISVDKGALWATVPGAAESDTIEHTHNTIQYVGEYVVLYSRRIPS